MWIHIFLTSPLAGGEWSASRASGFTAGERDLGTHWIGGWVGPALTRNKTSAYFFFQILTNILRTVSLLISVITCNIRTLQVRSSANTFE
jgi:hypothetical protein